VPRYCLLSINLSAPPSPDLEHPAKSPGIKARTRAQAASFIEIFVACHPFDEIE